MEVCPRRKILSDMASIPQICIPTTRWTFQEAQERRTCPTDLKERGESPKDLRKSCCHRIKCTVTTFLAAFMWRKHLNSETLVITTHREPKEVFDGTDTQVKSQMNDKCKIKMIRKELYNVNNHLWKGDRKKSCKRGEQAYQQLHMKEINWHKNKAPRIESLFLFVFVVSLKLSLNLW